MKMLDMSLLDDIRCFLVQSYSFSMLQNHMENFPLDVFQGEKDDGKRNERKGNAFFFFFFHVFY